MNYQKQIPLDTRSNIQYRYLNSPFCVSKYLTFLPQLFSSPSLSEAIEVSIGFYESNTSANLLNFATPARSLLETMTFEREVNHIAVKRLIESIASGSRSSSKSTIKELVINYIDSTKYLLPLFHAFSQSVHSIEALSHQKLYPCLVLRDALVFLPSLSTLNTSDGSPINFLLYSRTHAECGVVPRLFSIDGSENCTDQKSKSENTLLIDVGLYGSLVDSLISKGWSKTELSAFFFASRTPFISGWINSIVGNSVFQSKNSLELLDIIRLADSIESLLKPFVVLPPSIEAKVSVPTEVFSDPSSFVCSTVLLWAAYQYSLQVKCTNPSTQAILAPLLRAKQDDTSWFIRNPIIRWSNADAFISKWKHGPLFPMSHLCGFKV